MKKNILATYTLMLISLLSCNISSPNELMSKKKENGKTLGFKEKIQEDLEVVQQHLEEREKQIVQAVSVEPINVERTFPYYLQEEIDIKEEELVPSTDEEKKAEKAIIDGSLEFAKLIDNENKLKNEYAQLESSFNEVYSEILRFANLIQEEVNLVGILNHKIKTKTNKKKKYQKIKRQNTSEKQDLINLFNQLSAKRGDIEELNTQLYSGLGERASAKYFFEKAQKTLKDAIAERLKNKSRSWARARRIYGSNLAIQAENDMDNALSQLNTSSSKISKAMKIKDEIEQLVQKAKSVLDSSKSKICSSDNFVIFN
ncbi:P12 family lipoprotein [Borreliella bavariensis]|uniref:P12 family lipoprotein n=1 Tax=Borreliella bavariensis TaxID=664662 RepID=UPI001C00E230|nr:P12 family lipoprotein [Borreliella bavariensis]